MVTKAELISFEEEVAAAFEARKIHGPIHLSGGNEDQLIEIFKKVGKEDWVFSTWRNHYHALLKGIPREQVMEHVLRTGGMNMCFPLHRFYTSAIVGGICPPAVGVAAAILRKGLRRKVWCFLGDMAARSGVVYECAQYADGHRLPLVLVVEDNHMSTNTPTVEAWGVLKNTLETYRYAYKRKYPHMGIGKWVNF